MNIYYDMYDDLSDEEFNFWVCDTYGTVPQDFAAMNTEVQTVRVCTTSCFGDTDHTYTFGEFLEKFWENPYSWPEERLNLLINDVKEMNEK